jgi:hypothetical protein
MLKIGKFSKFLAYFENLKFFGKVRNFWKIIGKFSKFWAHFQNIVGTFSKFSKLFWAHFKYFHIWTYLKNFGRIL